jgi:hypothetical protein
VRAPPAPSCPLLADLRPLNSQLPVPHQARRRAQPGRQGMVRLVSRILDSRSVEAAVRTSGNDGEEEN